VSVVSLDLAHKQGNVLTSAELPHSSEAAHMIRISVTLGAALVLIPCLGSVFPVQAADHTPSDVQIARWVRDLDDDRFAARESATGQLRRAGRATVPALTVAAVSANLEVSERAIRVLREMLSAEESTASDARQALTRLVRTAPAGVAGNARSALREHLQRIVADLEKGKAQVTVEGDRIIGVDLDSAPKLAPLLPLLRTLPDLQTLSVSNKQMDDAGLAHLKMLPRLGNLNLSGSSVGDEGLKHLQHIPSLRSVSLGQTKVTDAGLEHIKDLTHLEYVGLRGNRVTDAGLVHLRNLTNLTGLYLGETKVTDAGLVHLKGMKKLNHLPLHNTAVTDAGLEHLKEMANLKQIDLWKTRVTPAGVSRLQQTLPAIDINLNEYVMKGGGLPPIGGIPNPAPLPPGALLPPPPGSR